MAVNLSNCDEVQVLGKVLEATANRVKVHYWKGSFKGKWNPHNVPRTRTSWVMISPRTASSYVPFP